MITPVFIVDENRIRRNCEVLASVKERTGCKILLAPIDGLHAPDFGAATLVYRIMSLVQRGL